MAVSEEVETVELRPSPSAPQGYVVPAEAVELRLDLERRNVHVRVEGNTLIVGPLGRVTEAERAAIRRLKPWLLQIVAYEAPKPRVVYHSDSTPSPSLAPPADTIGDLRSAHVDLFFATAREREAIRRRRAAGDPWPWTDNAIFAQWKFTNVFREHDKTTVWFREHVRSRLDGLRVVEATVIFRWFNRIETGERLKDLLLDGWDRAEAYRRLAPLAADDVPIFTGAYRVNSEEGRPKLDAILNYIDAARERLPFLVPKWGRSLEAAWRHLLLLERLGTLTAYEIVSDLRWTPVLADAEDIQTWAAAGPGCAAGLGWLVAENRKRFRPDHAADQREMVPLMRELLARSRDPAYWPYAEAPWEMREAEGWCCELAKFVRAQGGGQLRERAPQPGKGPSAHRGTADLLPSLFPAG